MAKTSERATRVLQLVAGISVNGKITDKKGDFSPYSSSEDQQWLHQKIEDSDVLVLGRKTLEQVKKPAKKPMIVFTRSVKGIRLDQSRSPELHWFNDDRENFLDLCNLLQYQTVTILGGGEVYHWCIANNLVTDLYLTVEPYLFDGGKNLLMGQTLPDKRSWKLRDAEQLNSQGSLLLHYTVV